MDAVERADRVCDDECRGANGCAGHVECGACGKPACGCETEDGLCPDCAATNDGVSKKSGYCVAPIWIACDYCVSDSADFCTKRGGGCPFMLEFDKTGIATE